MKQKCSKAIVVRFVTTIFTVFFSSFVTVFAQYYYFSSGWNSYQQWCDEILQVRVNSEWQNIRGGRFHLLLDPLTTIYPKTSNISDLRNFFGASTDSFIQWSAATSPSWKEWSNYTILRADRNNWTKDYNGSNALYANIKFKPVFSGSKYDVVFGMEYISGTATFETTLSVAWWAESINSRQQELYRTWTFAVLQEPCVADTDKPTISNISVNDGSSKISYLSWLSFSLEDKWWVAWVENVPYVWSEWWEWTWNAWWKISNQYWIDQSKILLELNWNRIVKTIDNTSLWFNIKNWKWKTWQNHWLNADVFISSGGLFDFWIEKEITATFVFYDRAWNLGKKTITFNSPRWPELISNSVSPKDADIYVNLNEPIKLWIKDDWAGVKSGTIKITVSGINWTSYWPYVFSGSDLNLSGVQWEANEPDYYINITNHEKFPTSGTIKVVVYAKDMEWTVDIIDDYSFSTRPDCTEIQCCDPILLDLWSWNTVYYANTWLIISGWDNPTFSVDSVNNTWVIDCNTENEWLSVYQWDSFSFFTDDTILTILWTWVKWILSWNVLTLSYIISSAQVIIDKPQNHETLTWIVDIQWHLTWMESEDILSWYIVQIYSWEDLFTWWFVSGTWIVEILPDWEYDVFVYPVDKWWHSWDQAVWNFVVDKKPECTSWYSVPSWWTSGDAVMVYLTWCSEAIFGDTGHEFTSNTWYLFNFVDGAWNTWELSVQYTWFDREVPLFELYAEHVYQCQTWVVIISGAVDTWIWLDDLPYSFDNIIRSLENEKQIYSDRATWVFVSWYVRDWLWNQSVSGVILNFEDSKPSATWFTVYALNWIEVDWKELSNATDWACWSWTLFATVTWWNIWQCTISGNILSYKPNDDYVSGSDSCELTIYDVEWNSVTWINVEFMDINKYPYVSLISPKNWEMQSPWNILFSWSGVWNEGIISGFVYKIWNTVYDKTWELTWFEISVDLDVGAYNWYVYAVFLDWTTWWLSTVNSFNIVTIPSWNWWWGRGWGRLTKDRCPDGDESDSYYDGTCEANWWTHWSSSIDFCGVDKSFYSTEQKFAYLYSYVHKITTMCPIQDANIDGYLIRSHFAKMISEFAVNVLGNKPEIWKTWCAQFNDIDKLNIELRSLVVKSCELWLMWLESDWKTPSKSFNPSDRVTRAQFGTVLSRLLFGDFYNIQDGETMLWYQKHLQALKEYWIMTKIDGDWPNYLEKRWWVMIMLQRADNYWIFAWKIPAKNWVKALFDE